VNGAHDLGGLHGFGPVAIERNEPLFHAPWEARALAITLAASLHGRWNIDTSRFVREDRHPADYLATPYYGLWTAGLEVLAARAGMLDGSASFGPAPSPPAMREKFAAGFGTEREAGPPPRFAAGDQVRVREMTTPGHTRCPRYCRARVGSIHARRGNHVFPDSNAQRQGEDPQPLYTVRFAAADLFGPAAEPDTVVFIDLWQPYLDAA
jgi:nitrile hydratase